MRIVIVGDGKVGAALAAQLTAEEHDVVMIDSNPRVLAFSQDAMDIMTVQGNGASYEVQVEAGVATADLLIAATSLDETNLLCCFLARKLGCKNTIARVRTKEYAKQVDFLKKDLGLSMTVNPEKAAATEICRLLQLPSFLKRDTFAHGRVELVELKLAQDSPLAGRSLKALDEVTKVKVLVCAVERDGVVSIPSGEFVLKSGDKISVTAATRDLAMLIERLSIAAQKIRRVIIIGGSRIAAYLAEELLVSRMEVKIIELDEAKCEQLSEQLPDALVINGDGSQSELLLSEDIKRTDALVTLTGLDEENIVMSMNGSALGVPKVITKVTRDSYSELFRQSGIGSVIDPKTLTVNQIIHFVRAMDKSTGDSMVSLHSIVGGKAEALEFIVTERTYGLGQPLRKLKLKPNTLIACIGHGTGITIPSGNDTLQLGDTVVIVVRSGQQFSDLNDIFDTQADKH